VTETAEPSAVEKEFDTVEADTLSARDALDFVSDLKHLLNRPRKDQAGPANRGALGLATGNRPGPCPTRQIGPTSPTEPAGKPADGSSRKVSDDGVALALREAQNTHRESQRFPRLVPRPA